MAYASKRMNCCHLLVFVYTTQAVHPDCATGLYVPSSFIQTVISCKRHGKCKCAWKMQNKHIPLCLLTLDVCVYTAVVFSSTAEQRNRCLELLLFHHYFVKHYLSPLGYLTFCPRRWCERPRLTHTHTHLVILFLLVFYGAGLLFNIPTLL